MTADCATFLRDNAAMIERASEQWPLDHLGHGLWLTRNRHGAGFWDRDELPQDVRDALTEAAHKMGECDLYIGDDGLIYST